MMYSQNRMILLGIGVFFNYSAFGTMVDINCDNIGQPVQQIIDEVPEDSVIWISGVCYEPIKIEKDRITVSGKPRASFVLSQDITTGISISGRQIVIKNVSISGADKGIVVYRAGSARIVDSKVSNSGSIGVEVTGSSYARITKTSISSSRRNGIVVRLSSSADIHENNISQNNSNGITLDSSSADVDGNTISDNKDYGIFLHGNAKVRLGGDNASGKSNFFSNNLNGGIRCDSNSVVEVRIDQQFDTTDNNYDLSNGCVITAGASD